MVEVIQSMSIECRVCLKTDMANVKTLPLFEKYKDSFIYEKLLAVANVDAKPGDSFPSTICINCWEELENAYTFKQKCERSDAILHSLNVPNIPIETDLKDETIECESEFEYEYLEDDLLSPGSQIHMEMDTLESKEGTLKSKSNSIKNNIIKVVQHLDSEDNTSIIGRKDRSINLNIQCDDCGEVFKTKCKLNVHWKKVHLREQLVCKICKREFCSYKAYNIHVKSKARTCLDAAYFNIKGQGRSRVFSCKSCDFSVKDVRSMQVHARTHTGERPHACDLCHKAFFHLSALLSHKEYTHKIITKEGKCPDCGMFLRGRNKMYQHRLFYHSNTRYSCNICGKKLKTKESLRLHLVRHSGVRNFTCEVCAKTFTSSSELITHKTMVHEKSKLHACDKCNYKSRSLDRMRIHESGHTGTNVACDMCGKFLENSLRLELHKNRHDKNVECVYCNRMFHSEDSLMRHVRAKHKIDQDKKLNF